MKPPMSYPTYEKKNDLWQQYSPVQQLRAHQVLRRCALVGGVVAPPCFALATFFEEATRPGYNAWHQSISALSLSDQGWMQIINFVVCGLLILGFAGALRHTQPFDQGTRWVPLLLGVVGGCLILCGLFVADPSHGYPLGTPEGIAPNPTLHENLHFFFSIVGGCALPGACFALARRFFGDLVWLNWVSYSAVSGLLMLVGFAAYLVADLANGPAGLVERLSILVGMTWVFCLSVRMLGQERGQGASYPLPRTGEEVIQDDAEETQRPYTILLLMADTGAGHRSAANAIRNALHALMPKANQETEGNTASQPGYQMGEGVADGSYDTLPVLGLYHSVIIDAFAVCGTFPMRKLNGLYGAAIRYTPWLYGVLFHLTNSRWGFKMLEHLLYGAIHRGLANLLTRMRPDLIISVHPLLNHVSLRVLDTVQMRVPFVTVMTDLVTAHLGWIAPSMDTYIVPTEVARLFCQQHGIADQNIHVLGMPIDVKFTRPSDSKEVVRKKLGLHPTKPTVLLMGGGDGAGKLEKMVRALWHAKLPLQLLVVTGRNERLRRRLEQQVQRLPDSQQQECRILGFVQNMPELMWAADVLVTKAGTCTICEAIACQVPIILSSFVPGQEEGNVGYVCDQGIGLMAERPEQLISTLRDCFQSDSPLLEQMRTNMARLQNPHAAASIAESILAHLPREEYV